MKSKKILAAACVPLLAFGLAACFDSGTKDASPAPDCFVIEDVPVYSNVSTLEGELVSSYDELNLVALMTENIDVVNGAEQVVTVYDLETGESVYTTQGMSFDWLSIENFNFSMEHYPLAVISYDQAVTDEFGNRSYETYYNYYLMNGELTALATDIEGNTLRTGRVGNLNLYGIDNTLYWVTEGGRVIRSAPIAISDTYEDIEDLEYYLDIDAEFDGFIYSWEFTETSRMVQIYNPSGVCTVQYKLPTDALLLSSSSIINPKAFVLGNGNVVLQYVTEAAEDATNWDLMDNVPGTTKHFDVHSLMINKDGGEVTELDLDFIISDLESAYAEGDRSFPFTLASGYSNQAYIVHFKNGYLSEKLEYVVLDNDLNTKFTFRNDYMAYAGNYPVFYASEKNYIGYSVINGKPTFAIFDWNGSIISELAENMYMYAEFNDDYYVTPSGVYDAKGNLKYDLVKNGFVPDFNNLSSRCFSVLGDNIYLFKFNPETDGVEVYALNTDNWSTTLMADGVDLEVAGEGIGYFKVQNVETGVSTLYNSNNEVVLKVLGSIDLHETYDVAYVTVNVDGEDLVYVLNPAKDNSN